MIKLRDYEKIVGKEVVDRIWETSEHLKGKHVVHVNTVYTGGGVAEILNRLVILMNEVKINTGWRILKGSHTFFNLTKKFHNAMQGDILVMTEKKRKIYSEEIERNSVMNHIDHDLVVIHDSQPMGMINHYEKKQPWIWRCHVDMTSPHPGIWNFVMEYLPKYDGMIVSLESYKQDVRMPQFIIPPSIDPLSEKNKTLSDQRMKKILSLNGIDDDKPLICQVSRFDKWKNPLGVLKMFEQIRKKVECRLILLGDMAADDPEGPIIYHKIMKKIEENCGDIQALTIKSDLLVNALQKKSSVVIQNSSKEGFGLVVTEALWKETPVVTRNVGGIPLQVIDGKTGYLIDSNQEAAKRCIELINNDKLRETIGKQAKEHVRKNFLITRHMQDYIDLFNHYLKN
jgi:trehalose synthase